MRPDIDPPISHSLSHKWFVELFVPTDQSEWNPWADQTLGRLLLLSQAPELCYTPGLEGLWIRAAAAAAKLLQSCTTLCDPIDSGPPGSPIPGILQARTLEWVAISFSNAWKWKVKVKSLSRVWLFETPWTTAHQAPPSMGFSRQEYWSGVPLTSPSPSLAASPGDQLTARKELPWSAVPSHHLLISRPWTSFLLAFSLPYKKKIPFLYDLSDVCRSYNLTILSIATVTFPDCDRSFDKIFIPTSFLTPKTRLDNPQENSKASCDLS